MKLLTILFIAILTFAFLLSGISLDVRNIAHITTMSGLLIGFILLLKSNKKLDLPPNFVPLLIFVAILNIYWIFVKEHLDPFYYSLTFTEGLSLWFIVYNLEAKHTKYLQTLFLVPLFIYSVIYYLASFLHLNLTSVATMYFQDSSGVSHQQIGNLAAVSFSFLAASTLSKTYYITDLLFYILSVGFLVVSKSRTALIGVFTSLLYVYKENKLGKLISYLFIAVLALGVVYMTVNRSLLLSRVYFIQSLVSFPTYPFGIGMGNFRLISQQFYYNNSSLLQGFSEVVHNIFLESLSGVGIFSIPFFYWGYKVVRDLIKAGKMKKYAWTAAFITLSVVFMVDLTYRISGMLWVWLLCLGMSQREMKSI